MEIAAAMPGAKDNVAPAYAVVRSFALRSLVIFAVNVEAFVIVKISKV